MAASRSIPTDLVRAIRSDITDPVERSHIYQPIYTIESLPYTVTIPHSPNTFWTQFRYNASSFSTVPNLNFRFYISTPHGDIPLSNNILVGPRWTELEWPIPSVNGEIHVEITSDEEIALPMALSFRLLGFTNIFESASRYVYRDVNYHACIEVDTAESSYKDIMNCADYEDASDTVTIRHSRWYLENASSDSDSSW
jgi:hypothetical protein